MKVRNLFNLINFMQFFLLVIDSRIVMANRIASPVDRAKRCADKGVPGPLCKTIRDHALKINCITKVEYETLIKYGAYPSCNSLLGEGLMQLDGWCPCGCFHPHTLIRVVNKEKLLEVDVRAQEIVDNKDHYNLVHLASTSSLRYFELDSSPIRLTLEGDETHPLIAIWTDEDKVLKLTSNHPVLFRNGKMVPAKEIKVGDELINLNGFSSFVVKVGADRSGRKVVNFSTDPQGESDSLLNHIIFAEGYAVGDQYWQASLQDELNQIIIRK